MGEFSTGYPILSDGKVYFLLLHHFIHIAWCPTDFKSWKYARLCLVGLGQGSETFVESMKFILEISSIEFFYKVLHVFYFSLLWHKWGNAEMALRTLVKK